ncbi:ATPase synthesis protein 25, mitochondrial [Dichotomopilus funicola]|uniref:ATPase synthesis protein 25 n=1 Tax=Dichotomopilus funicola TaxID=1934379 RepID=A0AAN6V6X3_9PEZI|nr:ATPase synthesis protein 25, mitochondrial [Dichotomopilus funicola]
MLRPSAAPASILRAARCPACRASAARPFMSTFAARDQISTRTTARSPQPSLLPRTSTAAFSAFRPSPNLLRGPSIEELAPAEPSADVENTPTSGSSSSADSPPDKDKDDKPWYLQVEPPRHPTLLHTPSTLPSLPSSPPKILPLLLPYLADDLGLDALSILDLRTLDPPPALGPRLIMLFATARSERHLHVSADRLVRWLRGRGIAGDADGLLGRNELKTKLRRLARKAKLLGTSGVVRGGDDGISTGWVCVNLGMVGGSVQEVVLRDEQGRTTGFGVPQTGETVVVQMMTEGRREELDLERYWGRKLEGARKRRERDGFVLDAPGEGRATQAW